ncbi:ABC transporter permease [Streptococcus constellatus subsp. pharyngis]|uniref:Putative membrane protein n=1 Tax=Streptococcus constellatus subsp. pharyngis SK1060 = CCUG 46377 TaxID=1035184 RepID=F9P591_STRCV|nr:ABC transporter permease [Streptococcus constellatus]AGU72485.1 putative ABC transporter, permease component [Streptococcus constellatus subsp. pharyngis C232]AGU74241.1 putative ABC transporter, permease component [Streptococcus constellatus subsp. pharyngis C818]AGU79609.1 putative ABC transporter, permease component [Streptococcus constellatus subsp. pharyngis C1050]EGV10417.1 putative membrane protein [Streptococcus constellatus subsp. pharyngis SK1060 = CCUG 46377]QQC23615.1 ABC transp
MKQTLIVIKETYLRHVKSWSFVFMVLSPFIFIGLSFGVGYLSSMSSSNSSRIAVVANHTQIKEVLKDTKNLDFDYKDEAAAKKAVKDGDIGGYLLVSEVNGQIKATYFADTSMNSTIKATISQKLMQLQQVANISQANLSDQQVKLLSRGIDFKEKIDEKKEAKKTIQTVVATAIGLVLYMILIVYTSSTAQEIASEKGTKIMEVIFSSIKASEYFYGRMAGIFAVILTHVGIYVIGAVLLLIFSDKVSFVKEFLNANPNLMKHLGEAISFNTIAFITLSVFLFVVLSAFLGSMVTRIEDVGKAVQPVVMLVVLGFLGVTALGNAGDTILLKVGSYIPFISTFFMPFRAINGYATSLEAWISFVIAFLFTTGMTVYIGRIYSSLILQTDDIGIWKSFKKALAYR